MAQEPETLRALLCEDDPQLCRAISTILGLYGFGALTVTRSAAQALSVAAETAPHVAVVDLAATAPLGVRIVTVLRGLAPGCAVMVVAAFPSLRRASRDAGADGLVELSDLRPLGTWLSQVRQAAHVGTACECCSPATTSSVPGSKLSLGSLSSAPLTRHRTTTASRQEDPVPRPDDPPPDR
ncbi:MAG TPA: response regulator [Acidimicrobiales bacterium]|nr:response regulator [Acidimicrobiales bacterium]